ncbi:UNKNOWN [Stylonychia lemnae]|uniref:Uncharacterized protein n=1 Tax=Stylonychia lemnae TaxID=5949 RepID=A0A078B378_STYLE|nr:UNKNOWN [Stylonychia lemnae]|eukprot:CDW87702.1 UNKNOWN [Stylonychia lemnae]
MQLKLNQRKISMFLIVLVFQTLIQCQQDEKDQIKSQTETRTRSLNFKSFTPTTSQQKISFRKKSQSTNGAQIQDVPVTQTVEPPLRSKRYMQQTMSYFSNSTWRVERDGTTIYLSDIEYQMLNSADLIFVKATTTKKVTTSSSSSRSSRRSKSSDISDVAPAMAGGIIGGVAFFVGFPMVLCYLQMMRKFNYKGGMPQKVCESTNCKRLKPKHEFTDSLYWKALQNGVISETPDEQIMRKLGIQMPALYVPGAQMFGVNPGMMTAGNPQMMMGMNGMNMGQVGINQVSPYGVQQNQQLYQHQASMMNQTAGYQVNSVQYPNTSIDKSHVGTIQTTPDNTFHSGLNDTSVIPMNKQLNN